jgi:hypothetical protein
MQDFMETPSPLCRAAVENFAQRIALDADELLKGQPFLYKEMRFRIEHYGLLDPQGIVLAVEAGEFTEESAAEVCLSLLEQNMRVPAGRMGYYSVMPDTSLVLFCLRIDLTQHDEPDEMIAAAVEALAGGTQRFVHELEEEFAKSDSAFAVLDDASDPR